MAAQHTPSESIHARRDNPAAGQQRVESTSQLPENLEVPPSERGKEEQMPLADRQPSAVFGVVAGSYFLILILALMIIAALFWWLR